jgi:ATPase family associated with various cellular activities (AAA)
MHSILVYGDIRTHLIGREPEPGKHGKEPVTIRGGAIVISEAVDLALESLPPAQDQREPPNLFTLHPDADEEEFNELRGFESREWRLAKKELSRPRTDLEEFSKVRECWRFLQQQPYGKPYPDPERKGTYFPRIPSKLQEALGEFHPDANDQSGCFDPRSKNGPETLDSRTEAEQKDSAATRPQQQVLSDESTGTPAETQRPPPELEGPPDETTGPQLTPPPEEPKDNKVNSAGNGRATKREREQQDPPWCPDIVVFDDLDADLRRIPISNHTHSAVPPFIRSDWKWGEDRRADYVEALKCIAGRLRHAGMLIRLDPRRVPLDPVIICCVSGKLPRIAAAPSDYAKYWDYLAHDPALCERTIVILDAKDLREHEHLAISSGLSWERTAQDTIAELTRLVPGRQVLAFSQVIVRYGVTGALHITRRTEGSWSYQLIFDPDRDEQSWTDSDADGTVLGYAAVFAGTLVQQLTKICNYRGHRPVLHDLAENVADAIHVALERCQRLVHLGAVPVGRDSSWFPNDLFADRAMPRRTSSVAVPGLRNRSWSIISQTAQGRTGEVARDIVLFGVPRALTQRVPTTKEFAEAWVQKISAEFWEPETFDPDLLDVNAESIENHVKESFEEVVAEHVRLPDSHVKEYHSAPVESLVRLVVDKFMLFVESARVQAAQDSIARFKEHDELLEDLHFGLKQELLKLLSQSLRLPSRLHSRFDPVVAPLVRFGKDQDFVLVDRREIEGVRAIHKLVKSHLDGIRNERDPTKHRPLSIAVFGPPGSGKSTAVKKIVDEFEHHETKTHRIKDPFNLAQFTKSEDLDQAFEEIVKHTAEHKVPIVFFDEFDSRFQNEEWGWLKFFLSPMEDGLYRGKPVHTAIFVFAGGTSSTYAQFSLENRATTDPQVQAFGRAKGPDFVSRLRGFLNIVGVDPADPDDELYLIRRAIVIRSTLMAIQGLKDDDPARIDPAMLRATLFVPRYLNGARSIRTLLEMCSRSERRGIANSALPLIHQLNMLTDGKAFLDLLTNVSADDDNAKATFEEGEASYARKIVLVLGRDRFGEPPERVVAAVDATANVADLEALTLRLGHVASWQELLSPNGEPS